MGFCESLFAWGKRPLELLRSLADAAPSCGRRLCDTSSFLNSKFCVVVVALHLTREQMQQRHHFPHEQESLRLVGPVALGVLESNGGRSGQLQPSPVHAFAHFW